MPRYLQYIGLVLIISLDEHPLKSSTSSSTPPDIIPRTFASNRPSRTRYIIERPKRFKRPIY